MHLSVDSLLVSSERSTLSLINSVRTTLQNEKHNDNLN